MKLVYFDGFSRQERYFNSASYEQVSNIGRALPPGYIWHIETVK
ncbi:hypothetical protein [Vibrio parahaemolyticus]|nr:hypothetical protein [Vibrio parahaemolyticus]